MSIYNHLDYKNYLNEVIQANQGQRGYQSQLCQAMECSNSLLSQTLNGKLHLTLEHSHRLGAYLGLTDPEHQYLLAMVQYARAGTSDLKDYLLTQIENLQEQNNQVSTRLKRQPDVLGDKGAMVYARNWTYPAIHILINIKRYQTPDAIAELLRLPLKNVMRVLTELKEIGLVAQEEGRWVPGVEDLHIAKDNPVAPFVHVNWRYRTISKILESPRDGTHYSGIHALDAETYRKLKSEVVETIARFRNQIADSKCEDLVFMSLDLFKVE